jgi:hypothetical protein
MFLFSNYLEYGRQYDHKEVTSEDLLKAVKQLNTNKAADYFGITAENVIFLEVTSF